MFTKYNVEYTAAVVSDKWSNTTCVLLTISLEIRLVRREQLSRRWFFSQPNAAFSNDNRDENRRSTFGYRVRLLRNLPKRRSFDIERDQRVQLRTCVRSWLRKTTRSLITKVRSSPVTLFWFNQLSVFDVRKFRGRRCDYIRLYIPTSANAIVIKKNRIYHLIISRANSYRFAIGWRA